MLVSLHVKNLALIDEAEVNFTEGLNILTGETGAGKSIIIGSVNLALGAKAGKDLIRAGAESALVELLFQLEDEEQLRKVRDMDLVPEEDNTLLLQRKIMPQRSVCRVCGETVSAGQLRELAEILIDIHGQHEHQSLLHRAKQREILDDFAGGGLISLKRKLGTLVKEYRALVQEWDDADSDGETRRREAELCEFEVKEIREAAPVPGEDERLERDYRRMVNGKKIGEALALVHGITGCDQEGSAGESLGRALRELRGVADYDGSLADLYSQMEDIDGLLNDFNRGLADYMEGMEFDGEEFAAAEERLNLLNHLKSRYGQSIQQILDYCAAQEEKLSRLADYDTYRSGLADKMESAKEEILSLCGELSHIRARNAGILAKKMKAALMDLNFLNVEFEIQVRPNEEGFDAEGYDEVEFMISVNPGERLKPLGQIASGGELSRIMLALKTVLADKDDIHTLIFDEIDAGISGKTAWKVSEKLGVLGRRHQVICITHLPQIAAMADTHFLIEKNVEKDRTFTTIHSLDGERSLRELARLLGGERITDAALLNAREMKEMAANTKQY